MGPPVRLMSPPLSPPPSLPPSHRVSEGSGPHGAGRSELHQGGGNGTAAPGGTAVPGHPAAAAGPARLCPQSAGVHVRQRDAGTGLVSRAEGKTAALSLSPSACP